jgi:hypothetical protein
MSVQLLLQMVSNIVKLSKAVRTLKVQIRFFLAELKIVIVLTRSAGRKPKRAVNSTRATRDSLT